MSPFPCCMCECVHVLYLNTLYVHVCAARAMKTTDLLRSLCHQNLLSFNPKAKVRLRHLRAGLLKEGVEGHEARLIHQHAPQCASRVLHPHDLGESEDRTVVVFGLAHHPIWLKGV